jgi:hypothetical protein
LLVEFCQYCSINCGCAQHRCAEGRIVPYLLYTMDCAN